MRPLRIYHRQFDIYWMSRVTDPDWDLEEEFDRCSASNTLGSSLTRRKNTMPGPRQAIQKKKTVGGVASRPATKAQPAMLKKKVSATSIKVSKKTVISKAVKKMPTKKSAPGALSTDDQSDYCADSREAVAVPIEDVDMDNSASESEAEIAASDDDELALDIAAYEAEMGVVSSDDEPSDEDGDEEEEEEIDEIDEVVEAEILAATGIDAESDASDLETDAVDHFAASTSIIPISSKSLSESKKTTTKAIPVEGTAPEGKAPGVVYLGRIPHGFYEKEMRAYFGQFGEVSQLRLSRNKKVSLHLACKQRLFFSLSLFSFFL